VLLASFHGLPREYLDKGDPYHCHCQKTGRLLGEALSGDGVDCRVTFQSRFGSAEWLKPYTDETIAEIARSGTKDLAVITPGFSADCVETLEEIALQGAEVFHENGGERFTVVPCLNDSDAAIAMMRRLIANELKGWV